MRMSPEDLAQLEFDHSSRVYRQVRLGRLLVGDLSGLLLREYAPRPRDEHSSFFRDDAVTDRDVEIVQPPEEAPRPSRAGTARGLDRQPTDRHRGGGRATS